MRLTLRLKKKYFDEIKAGTKKFEYREKCEYWRLRIERKNIDDIQLIWGFPRREEMNENNQMIFPWNGYEIHQVVHEQWKNKKTEVYAIRLNKEKLCVTT